VKSDIGRFEGPSTPAARVRAANNSLQPPNVRTSTVIAIRRSTDFTLLLAMATYRLIQKKIADIIEILQHYVARRNNRGHRGFADEALLDWKAVHIDRAGGLVLHTEGRSVITIFAGLTRDLKSGVINMRSRAVHSPSHVDDLLN
jgi:hypothetical protein